MSKTAIKKGPNKKRIPTPSGTNQIRTRRVAAVAVAATAAKKLMPASGNAGNGKTRKKKLSHQQASQARDVLDAEFRDLRSGVSFTSSPPLVLPLPVFFFLALAICRRREPLLTPLSIYVCVSAQNLQQQQPPSGAATTTMAAPRSSDHLSEQSVQDLAGILGAL